MNEIKKKEVKSKIDVAFLEYARAAGEGRTVNCGKIREGLLAFISSEIRQASPQWISVKDKLPEKPYKSVLIITTQNQIRIGFYDEDYDGMNSADLHITNITHWMPLPEPPTSELKENE